MRVLRGRPGSELREGLQERRIERQVHEVHVLLALLSEPVLLEPRHLLVRGAALRGLGEISGEVLLDALTLEEFVGVRCTKSGGHTAEELRQLVLMGHPMGRRSATPSLRG